MGIKLPPIELERMGTPQVVFRAPSKSRAGIYHYIIVWGDRRGVTCTCEGAQFGHTCVHAAQVPMCQATVVTFGRDHEGAQVQISLQCEQYQGHPKEMPHRHGTYVWENS